MYLLPNYNIFEATNGEEAIKIALNNNIDLIFMDIMMPIMNGIDAAIKIKKIKPDLPIVAVSAYIEKKLIKLDCFDDRYLKPINLYEINNCLKNLL